MAFGASIKAFGDKTKREVNDKIVEIAMELFTEIVKETPVDKGVLINNWYTGTGSQYNNSYNENMTDRSGMASYGQIATLRSYKGFLGTDSTVSMSNSTPYAFRAEYAGWPQADGWSGRVGPYAMIAKAFIQVVPKYKW